MKKVFFAIGVLSIMASCASTSENSPVGADSTTVILPADTVTVIPVDTTVVDTPSAE